MLLVDILARELKAWPKNGCVSVTQEKNGYVYFWREKRLEFNGGRWSHHSGDGLCDKDYSLGKLPNVASDHATAIVTRADWQAAKDKLEGKTVKASKEGWIRHRGGKCPVEAGTLVDYRMRNGVSSRWSVKAELLRWPHEGESSDVMAWKLCPSSNQPANIEESSPVEPVAQISGPLQWRDRITEIDAESKAENERHNAAITALDTERAELVQRLYSEGLAMIERKSKPVEDMSDPANWREGDLLECVFRHEGAYTMGKLYSFIRLSEWGTARTLDDTGEENGVLPNQLKWHSRPTN